MMKQLKLHSLIREPLLHFLFIGAGLFILFNQIGEPAVNADRRIIITQADLDFLATSWLRSTGRPATALEREQQLEHYIREQVLSREAMAMGLDKDDVIVRRRL
ncbi:MAG: peptidyl-prolyl cis-trans isomerase, partial [Gammaproteobacteria bacterium]|nr:peptidyl-prolyl cis-trans isomerase [Gammaproteobacteria bacterium]